MTIHVDEKIRLDQFEKKHGQAIFDLASQNKNYLNKWLPWVDNMQSVDFIFNYISASNQRTKEGHEITFVIFYNDTIVGRIGVYKIDHQNKIGEIGYWIGEEFQGNGTVTKSCEALINYCFSELKLNRIEIRCGTENQKSKTIPNRINFIQEGIIRQGEFLHDHYIDLILFSMMKEDWEK